MQDTLSQLNTYISSRLYQRASYETIRAELRQSGWRDDQIEAALQSHMRAADPYRVRKGVLWIVSPFAAFVCIALLQFVFRFVMAASGQTVDSTVFGIIINIVSLLLGMAAAPMMIVGPIIGIVKLSEK